MLQSFLSIFRQPASPAKLNVTVAEDDNSFALGSTTFNQSFRDRSDYDRQALLIKIVNRYKSNPIAKRIVEITTEFVVGDGFAISSPNRQADKFLKEFWSNPLNDMSTQLNEWADEAWRGGDLFLLVSVDSVGMSYVRAVPAEDINKIVTKDNDYRQELAYKRSSLDENPYPAYNPEARQQTFMLHFPLNRMVGASFGESDLQAVLYWIDLFSDFLENRARLNYFRQLFTFILQKAFNSQPEKDTYVKNFAAKMPRKSGGILALGPDEALGVLNPQLASFEAQEDGLAIKRMIATGVGLPLHYLAEPEGSNKSTADAAGTPTFKRFKRRQQYMVHTITSLLQVVLEVRRRYAPSLPSRPKIEIAVPDITERDNATLAIAVQRITQAFIPLYNAKKITAKELIRLVYKFLAETAPETIPDETSPIQDKTPGTGPTTTPPTTDPGQAP